MDFQQMLLLTGSVSHPILPFPLQPTCHPLKRKKSSAPGALETGPDIPKLNKQQKKNKTQNNDCSLPTATANKKPHPALGEHPLVSDGEAAPVSFLLTLEGGEAPRTHPWVGNICYTSHPPRSLFPRDHLWPPTSPRTSGADPDPASPASIPTVRVAPEKPG